MISYKSYNFSDLNVTATLISFDEWKELEPWQEVNVQHSIFDTCAWNKAVFGCYYEHEGWQPFIIQASCDTEHFIIPLMLHPSKKTIRFIGHAVSDFIGIIGKDTPPQAIQRAFFRILKTSEMKWRMADFKFFPERNIPLHDLIRAAAAEKFDLLVYEESESAAYIFGDENFLEFLRSKRKLKQRMNKFINLGGYQVEHITEFDQIRAKLPVLFDMHLRQWDGTPTPSYFLKERNKEFYRNIADEPCNAGKVVLTIMYSRDIPAACVCSFVHNGQYLYYKICYDPTFRKYSPGLILLSELMKFSFEEGLSEFNFGAGGESYKNRFSNHFYKTYSYKIFRNPLLSLFYRRALAMRTILRKNAKGQKVYKTIMGIIKIFKSPKGS